MAAGSRVARGGQVPSTLLYMACLFMVTDSGILISFDVRTKTTLFAFGRP